MHAHIFTYKCDCRTNSFQKSDKKYKQTEIFSTVLLLFSHHIKITHWYLKEPALLSQNPLR